MVKRAFGAEAMPISLSDLFSDLKQTVWRHFLGRVYWVHLPSAFPNQLGVCPVDLLPLVVRGCRATLATACTCRQLHNRINPRMVQNESSISMGRTRWPRCRCDRVQGRRHASREHSPFFFRGIFPEPRSFSMEQTKHRPRAGRLLPSWWTIVAVAVGSPKDPGSCRGGGGTDPVRCRGG